MAICPFDDMVALVISTYHGKTESGRTQLESLQAGDRRKAVAHFRAGRRSGLAVSLYYK
jgi:hypothetical protein